MDKKMFLKTGISILLITAICFKIDAEQVAALLTKIDAHYLYLAGFFILLRTASGIHRLVYILNQLFDNIRKWNVIHDSLAAGFYNLFLPTALGGDIPKIFLLNKHLNGKKKIVAAVLTERFIGFFSLAAMALTSSLILYPISEADSWILVLISVIFCLFMTSLVLISSIKLPKLSNGHDRKLKSKMIEFIKTMQLFRKKQIINIFLQSLIYQSLGIVFVYYLGIGLGIELSIGPYFMVMPLIWFVTMIPISIAGIGLREGAFLYFFNLYGVSQEMAVSLSLLFFFQNVFVGSLGGILLLKNSLRHIPGSR
jgi:uncharacterized protein (TIRG00374 family)